MSKHTTEPFRIPPGPYTVGGKVMDDNKSGQWIVTVFADNAQRGDKIVYEACNTDRDVARDLANLAAAAPDLVEACEAARAAMGKIPFANRPEATRWQDPLLAACSRIDAALAKAKGDA